MGLVATFGGKAGEAEQGVEGRAERSEEGLSTEGVLLLTALDVAREEAELSICHAQVPTPFWTHPDKTNNP